MSAEKKTQAATTGKTAFPKPTILRARRSVPHTFLAHTAAAERRLLQISLFHKQEELLSLYIFLVLFSSSSSLIVYQCQSSQDGKHPFSDSVYQQHQ